MLVIAQQEARGLGHHYLGTEHLLLGVAAQADSLGGHALQQLGIGADTVRAGIVGIIGRGERPVRGPLDPDALASIGIDLDEVRSRVEAAFGRGALDRTRAVDCAGAIPFTPRSKRVLERAAHEAASLGHDYVGSEHLLLALAQERDGVAAEILADRGVDEAAIRRLVHVLLGG